MTRIKKTELVTAFLLRRRFAGAILTKRVLYQLSYIGHESCWPNLWSRWPESKKQNWWRLRFYCADPLRSAQGGAILTKGVLYQLSYIGH